MNDEIIVKAAEILSEKCDFAGYCTLAQIDTDGYPTAANISPWAGRPGVLRVAVQDAALQPDAG